MIGHDDENEEVHFKVADKRKFNADGSLRDGVTLDAVPEAAPKPALEMTPAAEPEETVAETVQSAHDAADNEEYLEDEIDAEDIPGAKDPASFVNFLSFIATNAATALGAVPHPSTGQRMLDLDGGKYWLDIIAMLKERTAGNLHPKEAHLLEGLLADLRMQYVHLVKATEEKLKAQAAAKFSDADILGKKQ